MLVKCNITNCIHNQYFKCFALEIEIVKNSVKDFGFNECGTYRKKVEEDK